MIGLEAVEHFRSWVVKRHMVTGHLSAPETRPCDRKNEGARQSNAERGIVVSKKSEPVLSCMKISATNTARELGV